MTKPDLKPCPQIAPQQSHASFTSDNHPTYLTPGKRYPVTDDDGETFTTVDDEYDVIRCRWSACPLLDGGDWTLHYEPDAAVLALVKRAKMMARAKPPIPWTQDQFASA